MNFVRIVSFTIIALFCFLTNGFLSLLVIVVMDPRRGDHRKGKEKMCGPKNTS